MVLFDAESTDLARAHVFACVCAHGCVCVLFNPAMVMKVSSPSLYYFQNTIANYKDCFKPSLSMVEYLCFKLPALQRVVKLFSAWQIEPNVFLLCIFERIQ